MRKSTIWEEYFQLGYRKTAEGRRQVFVGSRIYGGVWVRFNPLNPLHWRRRKQYRDWQRRWGIDV